MPLIAAPLDLPLPLLQDDQPAGFLFVRDRVFQLQRRRIGARRIFEAENAVVLDFINQRQRLLKIRLGFARESRRSCRT